MIIFDLREILSVLVQFLDLTTSEDSTPDILITFQNSTGENTSGKNQLQHEIPKFGIKL